MSWSLSATYRILATSGIICVLLPFKTGAAETSETGATPIYGKMVGNHYTNAFFGFSLTWPKAWLASTPVSRHSALASYPAKSPTNDFLRQHILLSLAEHPLGSIPNAILLIVMDDISPVDHVQSARDVLKVIEEGINSNSTNLVRIGSVSDEQIGGKPFSHQRFSSDNASRPVQQEYFATLAKNHALVFLLGGNSDEELNKSRKLVESITFAE